MKTIIIYTSVHHGNTKKIVDVMADVLSADIVDITKNPNPDITGYDLVGLASGVYLGSLHPKILNFANNIPSNNNIKKGIFIVSTCGVDFCDYAKKLKISLQKRNIPVLGRFQCRGYDTFGFWGRIGGIAKNRPNAKDCERARLFAQFLITDGR